MGLVQRLQSGLCVILGTGVGGNGGQHDAPQDGYAGFHQAAHHRTLCFGGLWAFVAVGLRHQCPQIALFQMLKGTIERAKWVKLQCDGDKGACVRALTTGMMRPAMVETRPNLRACGRSARAGVPACTTRETLHTAAR